MNILFRLSEDQQGKETKGTLGIKLGLRPEKEVTLKLPKGQYITNSGSPQTQAAIPIESTKDLFKCCLKVFFGLYLSNYLNVLTIKLT